ncbi:MAG: hypothetical protein C4530_17295 [Desulfobacteraceae bacterium]|nr:MAG: hypothetical protein C4530_17295 [Desulfobacteraceae bacterium]
MNLKTLGVRCRTALFMVLLSVLACGCANLSAIREFADISVSTAEYTNLTEEYVKWPQTQKRYQPESQYKRLESIAAQRTLQEKTLLLRHSLIEEYMDALGQLSADEVVTYDKEVNGLGKAAKEAKFIDEKEADAFNAVAKLLFKAATDAWRQAKLKAFVKTANPDIQRIIGGLRRIIDLGYIGDLEDENAAVQKYYKTIVQESEDKSGITALNEWRDAKLESIASRRKAMEAYSLSLKKISDGHQKLNDAVLANRVTSKEFLGQMSRYAKEIRTAYSAITKLQQ